MESSEQLEQWVVYHDPRDYPGMYVVRRWLIAGGHIIPDDVPAYVGPNLKLARAAIPRGLYRLEPMPGDERQICEVWI